MLMKIEKECEEVEGIRGCEDKDLVHELARRVIGICRYDQFIANANAQPELQTFWHLVKSQEQEDVRQLVQWLAQTRQLKQLLAQHVVNDCF